ncbi:MAG: NADH-quinone oxidoreductase subunit J [Anaerolineaceae bacterium]
MWYVLIAVGILACAILAISAKRLLISAIWLAITSALVALMLFLLGAPQIAVIELSVGAGLVTVLFVFAINIAGEDVIGLRSALPLPLVWASIVLAAGLIIFFIVRSLGLVQFPEVTGGVAASVLWQERYLDFLLQVVLILAGVLGVIGLLSHSKDVHVVENKA